MALLIYQKNNPQAIFVKGDMKTLNEGLAGIIKLGDTPRMIDFDGWNGKPVKFLDPLNNWMHVEEWNDADVTKYLEDQKKRMEDKQRAMGGRNQIQMPRMTFPPGKGN